MLSEDEDTEPSTNNKENDQFKRKYLSLFPTLFRKKSHRYKNTSLEYSSIFPKHKSFEVLNDEKLDSPLGIPLPISPRVKNFNSDMQCLTMSRTDNPYISQQIEQSNSLSSDYQSDYNCYALSTPILSIRKNRQCYFNFKKSNISEQIFDLNLVNEDGNLHDKLIRSPPPNFPEKISNFTFIESFIGHVENDVDDEKH